MASLCAECSRLKERCKVAAAEHAGLLAELRKALLNRKSEMVTALIVSEAAALRARGDADLALRKHVSVDHEGGLAEAELA